MFPRFDFPMFVGRLAHEDIVEGQMLPSWYYGHAYEEWDRHIRVFALIPLNYLMRFRKWRAHKWNKFRATPSWFDREIHKQKRIAHNEGLSRGLQSGAQDEARTYNRGFHDGVSAANKHALDTVKMVLAGSNKEKSA